MIYSQISTLAEKISKIPRKQTKFKHLYVYCWIGEAIVIFKLNFYFEIILDMQKNSKCSTE